jgi:hypothetical protein
MEANAMLSDYDGAWKDLIHHHFSDFLRCFFPEVFAAIAWEKPPVFLEQELREILSVERGNLRRVDLLVRVWTLQGQEQHILLHIEVQSDHEELFGQRIYDCHHLISRHHTTPVATLVALADLHPGWKPQSFSFDCLGTRISFAFACCKLLDELPRLEADPSILAFIAVAQIEALRTVGDPNKRLELRKERLARLFRSGRPRQELANALRLLAWMMPLPPDQRLQYRQAMIQLAQENTMPYMTDMEELALEEGRQKGRIGTLQADVIEVLEIRFDRVPEGLCEAIRAIGDETHLRRLLRAAIKAPSIEAFTESL